MRGSGRVRRSALGAAILGVTLALADPAPAQTLTFNPLNGIFFSPDTLTVEVVVDSATIDLRGITMVLEFDPSIVQPVSVVPGTLLAGAACGNFFQWLNATAVGDSIATDAAGLGCSVNGPGSLVEIRFVGVDFGTSPLACRFLEARDSGNVSLGLACVDGTITYEGVIGIRGATWGATKARYRSGAPPR